jgi:hypothetical protein
MTNSPVSIVCGLTAVVFFALILAYSTIFFQMIDAVENRTPAQEQARSATIAFISISAIALLPAASATVVGIIGAVALASGFYMTPPMTVV